MNRLALLCSIIGMACTSGFAGAEGGCDTAAACPETDVNCDDVTDGFDIAVVRAPDNWLQDPGSAGEPRADVNGDGIVDGFDIAAIRNAACWLRGGYTAAELAGNSLGEYPFFEYVRAFNENATVEIALDPGRFPTLVGETCDVYVVDARSATEWDGDPSLVDVTAGGAATVTFVGGTIQANTFTIAGAFELDGDGGTDLGVGYDVVLDCDRDGELSGGDYIDGYGDEAGLYAITDITQPGPLAVTEVIYSGGAWLGQDLFYPTDIGSMGQLPLVVISHSSTANYLWYDHIGTHMASYGYIVMCHQTNSGPGIETSSTTTLANTDYIIGAQDTIAGGVLDGHLDSSRITWIGHSRGGEGITRALDRLFDGAFTPANYDLDDILLLSCMAPTDFLKAVGSNPHGANFHLWTAAGDANASGSANCDLCQTFHLHDRATSNRHSTVVQGIGHGDFHAGSGSSAFTGPCHIVPRSKVHDILRGMFAPLIEHYNEASILAMDFFWRQYEEFHPIGVPEGADPCIVVTNTYRSGGETGNFRIDDYQSEFDTGTSSSGGAVVFSVENLTEERLDDNNSDFEWFPSDPMNGMTHASINDTSRGVVFDWNGVDRFYEWEIIADERDFTDDKYLSFRAGQGTRHPYTLAVLADLTFGVTLRDGNETTSTINIGAYGGGLEQPYQRSGGWHNELETIRIRLTDFLNNSSGLDLTDIVAVRIDCGPTFGSNEGRIGVDDVELTNDPMP